MKNKNIIIGIVVVIIVVVLIVLSNSGKEKQIIGVHNNLSDTTNINPKKGTLSIKLTSDVNDIIHLF